MQWKIADAVSTWIKWGLTKVTDLDFIETHIAIIILKLLIAELKYSMMPNKAFLVTGIHNFVWNKDLQHTQKTQIFKDLTQLNQTNRGFWKCFNNNFGLGHAPGDGGVGGLKLIFDLVCSLKPLPISKDFSPSKNSWFDDFF